MALIKAFDEPWIHIWLLVIFAFLAINYNDTIALIYTIMVATSLFLYLLEKTGAYHPRVPFNLPHTTLKSFGIAAGVFVAFIGVSIAVSSIFQNLLSTMNFSAIGTLGSVLNTWASTNPSSLILENSGIITLLTFGFFIATTETIFIIKIFYLFIEKLGIRDVSLRNVWVWLLSFVLGVAAVMFHLTAKGVTNNTALLLVFIFFTITTLMTIPLREAESSVYLHIFNNVAATIQKVKVF